MWITEKIDKNFWDLNPDWALMEPFPVFIETVGKRRSSSIMWSIYLVYYPSSTYYLKYKEIEERQAMVNKEYNGKETQVDFEEFTHIIKAFHELIPPSLVSLGKWELTLQDFDKYVDSLTFDKNFKQKTDGLKEKANLWNLYIKAKEDYERDLETAKGANWGGYQGSFLENGGLLD